MDLLQKARKDDLAALGEHANWATQTLTYAEGNSQKEHGQHLNWLANAVKKQPLTPEHKTAIEHFASMYHLPEVKNAKLQGLSIEQGLSELQNAERTGIENQPKKGFVSQKGTVLQPTKTGKAWHNLGVAGCPEEGKAGKHCGNTPALKTRPHERVLSLREPTNIPGKLKQHLTFVNNNGYITEAKGNANTKPSSKYHSDIIDLLENPEIKGFVGGGYAAGSNFDPSDVTDPALQARLENLKIKKPSFFSPDISDLHETIRKDPFLALTVTNKKPATIVDSKSDIPLEEQIRFANHQDRSMRQIVASNPNLHPSLHEKLANDKSPYVLTELASNPNLHLSLHEKLANDTNLDVRQALARNPNLHPSLHEKLASDQDYVVRQFLAGNPNLHQSLHEKLASDAIQNVRLASSRNPNLHPSLHEKLANDEDRGVRQSLAKNPNLHPSVQEKLANDNTTDVRQSLAKNPNLHPSVQEKLANGATSDVRQSLALNPNLHPSVHEKLANDKNRFVRQYLARNPNLHPSAQEKLANDREWDIRQDLAKNPNLHPSVHEKLANDKDLYIRRALAANPNLHPSTQEKLANDNITDVRHHLAKNPNLSESALNQLDKHFRSVIENAQMENGNGDIVFVDDLAADRARESGRLLQDLNKRRAVIKIQNPNTTFDEIKRYEYSHNKDVAKVAQAEIQKRSLGKSEKLNKSEQKQQVQWLIKVKGEDTYHPMVDMVDLGPGRGNNYILADGRAVHQQYIEDLIIPRKPKELKKDLIPGGKGDKKPLSSFDPKEVKMGQKVEMEHTTDPNVAKEIEADHLSEDPKYYSKLKAANLADELEKVYWLNGKAYPEKSDKGKPHPEDPNLIGHIDKLGSPAWAQKPEITASHVSKIKNNFHKTGLSQNAKNSLAQLISHIHQDPDHAVMTSGTTKGHTGDFSELRMRHIGHAIIGAKGYSVKELPNGAIEIHAPRHAKESRKPMGSTTWHWDGKTLKSFGKDPIGKIIAKGEYSYGQGLEKAKPNDYTGTGRVSGQTNRKESENGGHDHRGVGGHGGRSSLGGPGISGSKLEKGLKGDWHKEGYEIYITPGDKYSLVRAYAPNGDHVGSLQFTVHPGSHLKVAPGAMVSVHKDHQRKGLASAMYQAAEAHTGLKFAPSAIQTGQGLALWSNKKRKFGKPEYIEDPWEEAKEKRNQGLPEHDPMEDLGTEEYDNPKEYIKEHNYLKLLKKAAPVIQQPLGEPSLEDSIKQQSLDFTKNGSISQRYRSMSDAIPGAKGYANLYRAYKNTPHKPLSLGLKYLIHRIENHGDYAQANKIDNASGNADKTHALDLTFLAQHQQGDAAFKNGHIKSQDLHDFVSNNSHLVTQLINHKRKIEKYLNKTGLVRNIDGVPSVGLTRGLNADKANRGRDHALASYADVPDTGFGKHMHHQWVPVKNIWYSYDLGKKTATSEKYGNENEWLVSPHSISYANEKGNDTKMLATRDRHSVSTPHVVESAALRAINGVAGDLDHVVLAQNWNHPAMSPVVLHHLARNPNLHPSLHEKLANDKDPYIRQSLAKNPNLHPSLHEKLANDEDRGVRLSLALNPNLHPSFHEKLANDEDFSVRVGLASNPNLHPSAQEKLTSDKDRFVREDLAKNPNLHPSLHEKLANDQDYMVRRALAKNPNLHPSVHEKLANDEDFSVRHHLAGNQSVSPEVKAKIQKSSAINKSLTKGRKVGKQLSKLLNTLSKSLTADQESEIIKKNQIKPENQKPHKFKAAQWTHPNGHPRCIKCGDEETISGICRPDKLGKSQPENNQTLLGPKISLRPKLAKSKKADQQSLAKDPKGQEVVDFAHGQLRDKLPNGQPGHENWANWYVKQYKANPAIHTPENQESLRHFMGMKHMPEIANFRFNNEHPSFEAGLDALKTAEKKGNERAAKDAQQEAKRWAPIEGTKEIDLGGGWGWWNLNKPYSAEEGKALNHCGNVEGQHEEGRKDKIYSLRQEDPAKPGLAKPHITAIMNGGYLGEIKGHSNSKPHTRFGDAMVSLLLHDKIKGVVGSGYAPEANFHGSDLTPEQYQAVVAKKPDMFMPRKSNLPEKFRSRNDLNPEVSDPEKYMSDEELQTEHNKKYNTEAKIIKLLDKHRKTAVYGRDSRAWTDAVDNVLKNPATTPEVIRSISNVENQPKVVRELMSSAGWDSNPKLNGIIPSIDGDRLADMGLLHHPAVSRAQKEQAFNHSPGIALKYGGLDHDQYVRAFHRSQLTRDMMLDDNPMLPASTLDYILDNSSPKAPYYFNTRNKNINQGHIDKMLANSQDANIIDILANRPDLTIPKETFDKLVAQEIPDDHKAAARFPHGIMQHPLFDNNNIAHVVVKHPHLGYAIDLHGHPKTSPDVKRWIEGQFEANELKARNSSLGGGYTESELERMPLFQKNRDKYIKMFKENRPGYISDWHTPEETFQEAKASLDAKAAPVDMLDQVMGDPRVSDAHKKELIYHENMPKEYVRRYAKHLDTEHIIESAKKLHNIKNVTLGPTEMDEVIKDWTAYPPEEGMQLGIAGFLQQNDVQMTPEQAKHLIDKGFLTPKQATDYLTQEDREQYAEKHDKARDKYHLLISHRKDKKELPLKAFKEWYKDVGPGDPAEKIELARQALHDENQARLHQLITRTLGPGAKDEDLQRYKYSHNHQVATAAQHEIKRRRQLTEAPADSKIKPGGKS